MQRPVVTVYTRVRALWYLNACGGLHMCTPAGVQGLCCCLVGLVAYWMRSLPAASCSGLCQVQMHAGILTHSLSSRQLSSQGPPLL